ncbi:MAG: gfo/Idh/MocA family oxidoreductase, partial [Alphaproteobacteria bacterium]|nr:gfo/Idh/MocA family oxidoreductase [Alphaproteobacteria bacterium]
EPGHDELCQREQELFLKAIVEDMDLTDLMQSAVDTFRLTMAADQSIREGRAIDIK